jgi:hypothetical protein
MPSFDATGTLNFFVGRAIDDKRRPKYDNPDTPKKDFIFNELNVDWTQRLVICEGPLDLVKCGDNAVPLLGSMLTEDFLLFEKILLNRTPVALALDCRDMKWKMQKYARKLAEYDLDVVIVDTGEKNDPGEMSKDEFKSALANARPWSWDDMFNTKLSNISFKLRL